jgi:hypothetical protein
MIHPAFIASSVGLTFTYFLVLLSIAVAFLKLNDWLFHRPRRKTNAISEAHEERLKNPDFEALERHFGHSFPPAIKALYANHAEILKEEFDIVSGEPGKKSRTWHIAFFEPADIGLVIEGQLGVKDVFEFANDGCGNGFTIDPRLDNPPVQFFDHETGERETVSGSFTEFIKMPRKE